MKACQLTSIKVQKNSQIRRADHLWFDEVVNLDIVTIHQRPKSRTRFGEGGREGGRPQLLTEMSGFGRHFVFGHETLNSF